MAWPWELQSGGVSPDDPPRAHRFGEQRVGVRQPFEFVSAHSDIKLPGLQVFAVCDGNALERTQAVTQVYTLVRHL